MSADAAALSASEMPSAKDALDSAKKGGEKAFAEAGKAVKEVQQTAKSLREKFKSFLGFDYFGSDDRKWYKDLWHGSVTNVLRRSSEATDATISALDSSFYSIWQPIKSPLKTVFRFDKYMAGGIG
ncbi:hypothetical protein HY605_03545, partial [Candidatus Peregrinibacteria bacterium]|nr:hypothetical protein [Candidatus Peregrinibacteria bacterium]